MFQMIFQDYSSIGFLKSGEFHYNIVKYLFCFVVITFNCLLLMLAHLYFSFSSDFHIKSQLSFDMTIKKRYYDSNDEELALNTVDIQSDDTEVGEVSVSTSVY